MIGVYVYEKKFIINKVIFFNNKKFMFVSMWMYVLLEIYGEDGVRIVKN